MIPDWLGGVATLALLLTPLWWLAGGRKPLSPRACAVVAAALGVLVLDSASRGDLFWSVAYLGACAIWVQDSAVRHEHERQERQRRDEVKQAQETFLRLFGYPMTEDTP